jgi:HEAT repeat protein
MFTLAASRVVLIVVLTTGLSAQQGASPSNGTTQQLKAKSPEKKTSQYREDAWKVLWMGLRHAKPSNRRDAVKALSLLPGDRTAIRKAVTALSDPDDKVRTAAAVTLGQLNAKSAIPALKDALSDDDVRVMLAAAHSLYVLKDPSAYDIYYAILMGDKKASNSPLQEQINRLKDPKQLFEIGLQEGLGVVPYGGMGYEAYKELLKHDNAPVRAAAARILALDPDSITEDALVQTALADKNTIVREAALDALAQRGDPRCIERLQMNLHDEKYAIRYRTAAAILELSRAHRRRPSSR